MYNYAILDDASIVIDFANDFEEAADKVNMSFWFCAIPLDQSRKLAIGERVLGSEIVEVAKKGGIIYSDEYIVFLDKKFNFLN